MKDFKQRFREATGLTYDVEKLLNGASNENKLKLFKKLSWMVGKGAKVENPETDEAKEYALVMTEICDTIQLPKEIRETLPEMVFVNEIINANQDLGTIVNTYDELIAAVLIDGIISLGADIELSNYVEINNHDITLNLNGHNIVHPITSTAKYPDAIEIFGTGKLKVIGKGKIVAENGYSIYAAGNSTVEIESGEFISSVSCIDARKNAIVTINGGTFKVDGTNNPDGDFGQVYTLNLRDKKGNYANELAAFIVKGGEFYNYNPAESASENPIANFVAEGYKSVQNGDWFVISKMTDEDYEKEYLESKLISLEDDSLLLIDEQTDKILRTDKII